VPLTPGAFSAIGLVTADARYDVYRSYVSSASKAIPETMQQIYREMAEQGINKIKELGFTRNTISLHYSIDLRYAGQSHEVTIDIPATIIKSKVTHAIIQKLVDMFHERHKYLFGHCSPNATVEFITLSVSATGPMPKGKMYEIEKGDDNPTQARKADRKVFFAEFQDTKLAPHLNVPI